MADSTPGQEKKAPNHSDALPAGNERRAHARLALFTVPDGNTTELGRINRFLRRHRIVALKEERTAEGWAFAIFHRPPQRIEIRSRLLSRVHHDGILWAMMSIAMVLTLHGKQLSATLVGQSDTLFWRGAYTLSTYVAALAGMGLLILTPRIVREPVARIAFVCVSAFGTPFLVRWTCQIPSALVFFTQLFLCGAVAVVVVLSPFLEEDMPRKYWETLLGGVTKGIRFVFILYAVAIGVLKFLSSGGEKAAPNGADFITSLFYPTIMFLVGVGAWCFWLVLPIWLRLHATWRESSESLIELDDDDDELEDEPEIGPDKK